MEEKNELTVVSVRLVKERSLYSEKPILNRGSDVCAQYAGERSGRQHEHGKHWDGKPVYGKCQGTF